MDERDEMEPQSEVQLPEESLEDLAPDEGDGEQVRGGIKKVEGTGA